MPSGPGRPAEAATEMHVRCGWAHLWWESTESQEAMVPIRHEPEYVVWCDKAARAAAALRVNHVITSSGWGRRVLLPIKRNEMAFMRQARECFWVFAVQMHYCAAALERYSQHGSRARLAVKRCMELKKKRSLRYIKDDYIV